MLPQRRGFEQKRRNYLCTRRGEHFQEAAGHHGREKKKKSVIKQPWEIHISQQFYGRIPDF